MGGLLSGIGNFFGSPLGGGLMNLLFGQQQHQLNQQVRQQQEQDLARGMGMIGNIPSGGHLSSMAQRVGQMGIQQGNQAFDPFRQQQLFGQYLGGTQGGLQRLPGQTMQQAQGLNQLAAGGAGDLQRMFNQGATGIRRGFAERSANVGRQYDQLLSRAQGLSSGLGQAERERLNQQFNQLGAQQASNLASRGLSASTIGANVQRGVEGQRRQALGQLGEGLRREQVGILGQFGGAAAAARERLSGQQLAAQTGLLQAQTGLGQGLLGQRLGVGQFGAGLGANVGLGALGQMGQLGMGQLGMMQQADVNRMNNLMGFGQMPLNMGLNTLGQGLGFMSSINRLPAQQMNFAQLQPGYSG
jgi:hypothetical protein